MKQEEAQNSGNEQMKTSTGDRTNPVSSGKCYS